MVVSTPALFAIMAIYMALCGFMMYFCVLADPSTSNMAYLLQVALPTKLWDSGRKVMGDKRMGVVQSVLDLALAFVYFFVVVGVWTVVFSYIYPWIDVSPHVGNYHKYIGYVVFLACFASWRLANTTPPGLITGRSFKRFDHYPYDHLMFLPNRRCDTTNLLRIPRSKFDRLQFQQNVPRYDHYCGWVNNTIGEENYRWFLLFLSIHVFMCMYGSSIFILLFWGEVLDKKLLEITFFDRATGEHVRSSLFIVSQYLFTRKTLEFGTLAVMFVMGIALGAFLGYHMYITSYNRTTNEDGKWGDIQKWYKSERKKYQAALKKGLVKPKSDDTTPSAEPPQVQDGDVTCTGGGAGLKQPGQMPEFFDPGPVPTNVYDRGFIENWKEVIFPISLRKDAFQMGGYSRPQRLVKSTAESEKPHAAPSDKKD